MNNVLVSQGRVDSHHLAAGRGVCQEPRGQDAAGGQETQGSSVLETETDTTIFRCEFDFWLRQELKECKCPSVRSVIAAQVCQE